MALAGLGRCYRNLQQTSEALAAYADLAEMTDAAVAGVPAPLVARRERRAIFAAMGDVASASRERDLLVADLRARSYLIDHPTFNAFTALVPPGILDATELAQAAALLEIWPAMQRPPSGRVIGGRQAGSMAAVWRSGKEESIALVAPVETLLAPALAAAERMSVVMGLENPSGQVVWRKVSPGDSSITIPLGGIGLPTVMRLSLREPR